MRSPRGRTRACSGDRGVAGAGVKRRAAAGQGRGPFPTHVWSWVEVVSAGQHGWSAGGASGSRAFMTSRRLRRQRLWTAAGCAGRASGRWIRVEGVQVHSSQGASARVWWRTQTAGSAAAVVVRPGRRSSGVRRRCGGIPTVFAKARPERSPIAWDRGLNCRRRGGLRIDARPGCHRRGRPGRAWRWRSTQHLRPLASPLVDDWRPITPYQGPADDRVHPGCHRCGCRLGTSPKGGSVPYGASWVAGPGLRGGHMARIRSVEGASPLREGGTRARPPPLPGRGVPWPVGEAVGGTELVQGVTSVRGQEAGVEPPGHRDGLMASGCSRTSL